MESWKKAVVVGSAGIAAVLLVKGRRPAGILVAGVGLAVLASEYPETFERIADVAPGPLGRGLRLVELISKAGRKLAEVGEGRDRMAPVDYEI
jgi:hypothetical protein